MSVCPRVGAHNLLLTALEMEKSISVARDRAGEEGRYLYHHCIIFAFLSITRLGNITCHCDHPQCLCNIVGRREDMLRCHVLAIGICRTCRKPIEPMVSF